jgi:hypothetical protein
MVTSRFFAFWEGCVELSTVMERSLSRQAFREDEQCHLLDVELEVLHRYSS